MRPILLPHRGIVLKKLLSLSETNFDESFNSFKIKGPLWMFKISGLLKTVFDTDRPLGGA